MYTCTWGYEVYILRIHAFASVREYSHTQHKFFVKTRLLLILSHVLAACTPVSGRYVVWIFGNQMSMCGSVYVNKIYTINV